MCVFEHQPSHEERRISEATGNKFVDPCTCTLEHILHTLQSCLIQYMLNWKSAQFDINSGVKATFPVLGAVGVL